MKLRILPLLLAIALLLCACGDATTPDTEQSTTLQMPEPEHLDTVSREVYTIELHFSEELPVGAVVELLSNGAVVLTHTVEAVTKLVSLTGEALHSDAVYALKVDGVLQQHSGASIGRPEAVTPSEDIPVPSQPAVEEAPANKDMDGAIISEGMEISEDMELPEDFSVGTLPQDLPGISGDIEVPSFSEIPSEEFQSGKAPRETGPTDFCIHGPITAFYGIRPAD